VANATGTITHLIYNIIYEQEQAVQAHIDHSIFLITAVVGWGGIWQ
jgi:hypothetical protein